jgi:hypothetical protein
MEADRKSDQGLKGIMNATQERLDVSLMDLKGEIKSGQAEMRSILCTFRPQFKEPIQCHMRAAIQSGSELDETTPDAGKMQSIEEHQVIPKGEAAVMPLGEPRKRRRVRNLASERRQKRNERDRG